MAGITGLHHVTCIAGDPQENLDFYTGLLGMRLVKKTVNQDVPGTYHLFYADGEGHAGTDLTFFPWPDMGPVSPGVGLASEVGLAVPAGSLEYWEHRLSRAGVATEPIVIRFGERALPFTDVHGLRVALIETSDAREFSPWAESPVPAERQVLGLHSMRLVERDVESTANFVVRTLGFTAVGEEDGWHRFAIIGGGSGRVVDVRAEPREARGRWGVGAVHHVAWRVPDDQAEMEVRERVDEARRRPTPVIDRFWFRSVYFLEPGGVLFELATDGPGFAIDESPESLGESLVLPPWLEPRRREIEAGLPVLQLPVVRAE
ncbi:MAG TPA: ring-cleaving dioxygenase [Gemmatimonadaceae bacterium]|nr:ring-cleaving dioxygenase [Gemmatimonadaceae bacterium]